MIEVISSISDCLVLGLATAGWPPLRPLVNGATGRIIIANSHTLDQFMPARVVFLPLKSEFGAKDTSRGTARVATNADGYDAESRLAVSNPAVATESVTFEVRCWGIASDDATDPHGLDYEYTRALYHGVIAASQLIMPGCYKVERGAWEIVSHVKRVGREFVFGLTVSTPVLQVMAPPTGTPGYPFAPSDVAPLITDSFVIGTGESSPGCEE